MEAIILAGGLGTRLASRLDGVPKPMAPVAGRPFLELVLTRLSSFGCSRAILSVGHLHHVIENHFGRSFHDMRLEYVVEKVPLGTGGAIRASLAMAADRTALVLNGDTFLAVDYSAMMQFHLAEKAPLTIAVTPREDVARYGGVVLAGDRIAGFNEKGNSGPGWINAGVYALQRDIEWPHALPESFSFERDYLVSELGSIQPLAYKVNGFFLDIGIPEDLDRAQTDLPACLG